MKIKDLINELQKYDENIEVYPKVMLQKAFKCQEFYSETKNMRKRDIPKVIIFQDKDTVEYQQELIFNNLDKRRKEQRRLQNRNLQEVKNAKEILTIKTID